MQQVPYWEPKIIRCYRAKYIRAVDLAPRICELLVYDFRNVLIYTVSGGTLQIVVTERDGNRRVFSFDKVPG